jgi:hypothetical protein
VHAFCIRIHLVEDVVIEFQKQSQIRPRRIGPTRLRFTRLWRAEKYQNPSFAMNSNNHNQPAAAD